MTGSNNYNSDLAVARYKSDGSRDPSFGAFFGNDGLIITNVNNGESFGLSVAIQADGKIVVAGGEYNVNGAENIFVARYNGDTVVIPSTGVATGNVSPATEKKYLLPQR